MPPDVEVVVIAFGAPELLDRCLASLGGELPVLVVDNSSDPDVQAVSAARGARYVDPGRNLGFGRGVNLGLRSLGATTDDILLLNPDATVTPTAVSALSDCLHRRADLAAVAPAQIDPTTGVAAQVGWPFPTPFGSWLEAVGLGRLRSPDAFMIGSVLLLRSDALVEVGRFDEHFFLYAEETDWQRRATDLGWHVALCPEVTATHVGAGTGGDSTVREIHFHASQERYIRKHHGAVGWRIYRGGALAGALVRALLLPGERGRRAADRFHLYRRGPGRVESEG